MKKREFKEWELSEKAFKVYSNSDGDGFDFYEEDGEIFNCSRKNKIGNLKDLEKYLEDLHDNRNEQMKYEILEEVNEGKKVYISTDFILLEKDIEESFYLKKDEEDFFILEEKFTNKKTCSKNIGRIWEEVEKEESLIVWWEV